MMPIRVAGPHRFLFVGEVGPDPNSSRVFAMPGCLAGVWCGANFLNGGRDRESPLDRPLLWRTRTRFDTDLLASTYVGIVEPRILARAGPRSAYSNSPRSNEPSASDLRGEP